MEKSQDKLSDMDMLKFMTMFKQFQNQPETTRTTHTETPHPSMKATPLADDSDLEFKNAFIMEERSHSLASQSKYYEAISLLENLDNDDEPDIGIELLKAECYIQLGRENKAEKAIKNVEKILTTPPACNVNDVIDLAKDLVESENCLRSLLLLRIAGDMFLKSDTLSPDDKVSGIFRCIKGMHKPVERMLGDEEVTTVGKTRNVQKTLQSLLPAGEVRGDVKDSSNVQFGKRILINERIRVIAFDYGVDVMNEMLEDLRNMVGASAETRVLKQAILANMINSYYSSTSQHAKAFKSLKVGIDQVETFFGSNANRHEIYIIMLLNSSIELVNVGKFKESEEILQKALDGVDHVLDFTNEDERGTLTRRIRESLRVTRKVIKSS